MYSSDNRKQSTAAGKTQPAGEALPYSRKLRQYFSRTLGISFGHHGDALEDHPTMFMCVPLRTGVFLSALNLFVFSLIAIFEASGSSATRQRQLNANPHPNFQGGYTPVSRVIVILLNYAGVIYGALGMAGMITLEAKYIKQYIFYKVLQVTAILVVFFFDWPLLAGCELWRDDYDKAMERYGWNAGIYELAKKGRCWQDSRAFLLYNLFQLALCAYLVCVPGWGAWKMLEEIEDEPNYVLRVPKDYPCSAYATRSVSAAGAPQPPPFPASAGNQAPVQAPGPRLGLLKPGSQNVPLPNFGAINQARPGFPVPGSQGPPPMATATTTVLPPPPFGG
eukprot:CAMPEP_0178418328 /NCGR_PEP_ID=MMETSP0689_2-20121128/25030_1 /TAXON_ID=160604 /ORGANISM="Amphidinium massartii, Strain CS-259" /LENGTH=335 /DNA_ID=CAMNT_0020039715 /DNA_START=1 /DNA_END=1004 /DNA_ORIENTATION=+